MVFLHSRGWLRSVLLLFIHAYNSSGGYIPRGGGGFLTFTVVHVLVGCTYLTSLEIYLFFVLHQCSSESPEPKRSWLQLASKKDI